MLTYRYRPFHVGSGKIRSREGRQNAQEHIRSNRCAAACSEGLRDEDTLKS
jgi:hypothetical protein